MRKSLSILLVIITAGVALHASASTAATVNAMDTLVFDMSQAVYMNDYASIPVYMITNDTVNALDFSLKFNESVVSYDSTLNLTNYLSALSFFNTNDRTLRFTSSSIQPIEHNKSLVQIRFIMLYGKKQMFAADFNTLKGYLNGDPCSVKVISELTTGLAGVSNAEFNVYPNPASSSLNIKVPEKSTVQLIDLNGQVIIQSSVIENQKQEINTQNIANGVYLLKIVTDSFVTVKKVVISK